MKLPIIIVCAIGLAACSTSKPLKTSEQFCDLKSDTVQIRKNGVVVEEKTVERMICNDNKVSRLFHAQSGIAHDCGEYKYRITLRGQPVERLGYACQKYDGTWEIVPHPSIYQ